MALRGDDRLERGTRTDLGDLGLTPQDFFLVSRVDDSKPTVDEVVKGSGLSLKDAKESIGRLVELEVLRRIRARTTTLSGANGVSRASIAARQAQRLRAGLTGGAPASRPASRPPSRPPSRPASRPADGGDEVATDSSAADESLKLPDPGSPIPEVLADENDGRLDDALDISLERQRQILGRYDRMGVVNHFELLGITPTNDVGQIRRAYHKLSRRFHPDAYYGKNIGDFQGYLTELFKAVRGSHDLLVSSERREAYVERLILIERQKLQVAEAKSREAKKRSEMQAALERQQREAIENKKREAERAKRAIRDQRRKEKMSSRLMGREGRESKAREHVRRAEAEIAADNYGAAAGLFRLAMDLVPHVESYHRRWEETLAEANHRRARVALENARELIGRGQEEEAAHFYEAAARAEPTPTNLAYAAAYLALKGDSKAHSRARGALDALRALEGTDDAFEATEAAEVHVLCAEAYMRLGQSHTARTQADLAKELDPKHPRLRSLLKKLKVG